MKKIFFLTVFITYFTLVFAQSKRAFIIFDADGKEVTFENAVEKAANADIVFFGELHNNPIAHWLELETAKALFDAKKENFVMGAEMFEADQQLIVDEYVGKIITAKNFEEQARLWPNYKTDYKPIMQFARENNIPFVATNIPRRYANIVFKKGFDGLNDLSDEAKKYIAPLPVKFDPQVDCYKQMIEGMAGMGNHGSMNIAKAQAVKDATMAYFILKNFEKGKLFYHFNGSFHSDNHQGICWYLQQQYPDLKIVTFSTVEQTDISKLNDENKNIADFIICVPENMTKTY